MDIKDIIETINQTEKINGLTIEHNEFDIDFDISPIQFLEYANKDLESEIKHKFINALSNAKRAIDGQIESLLKLYGFYKKSKKENWGFPKKLRCLNGIGIITPKILEKLNRQRNIMEHEFTNPESEKVEDFVDIASLFIDGTNRFLMNFVSLCEGGLKDPERAVLYQLYPENGIKIYIFDYTNYDNETGLGGELYENIFDSNNSEYLEILKAYHKIAENYPY
tara:strand:+ start:6103 stop:6771 length:669 start_codon:yes stop_codon:yes gene_type:complete